MKINLIKKPQKPIIIEGFPGFGLVGTIVTQFLTENLDCELIGEFEYNDLPALVTIHKGKLLKPMAVYYSKKFNLVILQTILTMKGKEWDIADAILDMAKSLKAKEIISIEGVNARLPLESGSKTKLFYYGDNLKNLNLTHIDESIVVGVTSAMMLKSANINCIFAETHSSLPDSKAAAKVIEVLDNYLGLNVDYKPLIKQAENFEKKLQKLLKESSKTIEDSDKKSLSYLG
jgi:uncharacterized protein